MNRTNFAPVAFTLAAAVALAACGKKEEVPAPVVAPAPVVETAPPPAPVVETASFVALSVGNQLDANQKATATADTFAPTDTIYATVATDGNAPNAAIVARWTFSDGQLVDESSQSIVQSGPANTAFHIAKPDGWPVGTYKVEITLDGNPVASEEFMVQ
ncbi:hypothetical protein [Dokdonella sp.]|uniref:hypothetical protein n=1 Tax=Dokdonella sp. TaxID=2291710 RepID=UPI003C5639CF